LAYGSNSEIGICAVVQSMGYNDFIFLVWWPDFTTAKKMGDFFGDSKRHLAERGSRGAPHKMKKTYWSRNEAFSHVCFQKEREKTILEFLSPLYL